MYIYLGVIFTQKLSRINQLVIGLTLFSMFFGAGNLIFPPSLGASAGESALPSFIGFAVSAIGLPVLGVIAVAKSGGLGSLTKYMGKWFALVFTVAVYLAIGPGLAIPRTASTSFEMAVKPFTDSDSILLSIVYSAAFFGLALLLAIHPSKIRTWLGKRLMPTLLVLICVLFFGCVLTGMDSTASAGGAYSSSPVTKGFIDGYQTMDAIAALIFGMIIAMNVRDIGVSEEKSIVSSLIFAGLISGILFLLAYGALTFMGVRSSGVIQDTTNGAQILTGVAKTVYGSAGQIIIALIFVIACLNTCVGLICCCASYFSKLLPLFGYKTWAVIFAIVSAVVANAGLDSILKISVPVLNCIYPVVITLIALAFLPERFARDTLLFPVACGASAAMGILSTLFSASGVFAANWFGYLPLADSGLAWIIPTVVFAVAGAFIKRKKTMM